MNYSTGILLVLMFVVGLSYMGRAMWIGNLIYKSVHQKGELSPTEATWRNKQWRNQAYCELVAWLLLGFVCAAVAPYLLALWLWTFSDMSLESAQGTVRYAPLFFFFFYFVLMYQRYKQYKARTKGL